MSEDRDRQGYFLCCGLSLGGDWAQHTLSVHCWHLAVVEAELFGLEAKAGDAVGHVDSRSCRT